MSASYDVFLAYANADRASALRIREVLMQARWSVFLDQEDVAPGENFAKRIPEELQKSRIVLLLLGDDPRGSPWLADEMLLAIRRAREGLCRLVPFFRDGIEREKYYGVATIQGPTWTPEAPEAAALWLAGWLWRLSEDPHRAAPPPLSPVDLEGLKLSPEWWSWVLGLARLRPATRDPEGIFAEAGRKARLPLLVFLLHALLGDSAPAIIRHNALPPCWDWLRPPRVAANPTPPSLAQTLDRFRTARPVQHQEGEADLRAEQVLGLLCCFEELGQSPSLVWPPSAEAALRRDLERYDGGRAQAEQAIRRIQLRHGDQVFDGNGLFSDTTDNLPRVDLLPEGLRAGLIADWLAPQRSGMPELVPWLCDGLREDPVRADVLAHLVRGSGASLLPELKVWAEGCLADARPEALVGLVALDLLLRHTPGPVGTPDAFAVDWTRRFGVGLTAWVGELVAQSPADISGATLTELLARRRVLERLPPELRREWCRKESHNTLARAIPGGGGPRQEEIPMWLEILSPDADTSQRLIVRDLAGRGSEAARLTLARLGWSDHE